MKLSDAQLVEAVTAARQLIQEPSTGFMDYNKMVTDDQIAAALTQVLAAVTEEPTP
jgi:uncharacterized protein YjgD (DUF1641 family)